MIAGADRSLLALRAPGLVVLGTDLPAHDLRALAGVRMRRCQHGLTAADVKVLAARKSRCDFGVPLRLRSSAPLLLGSPLAFRLFLADTLDRACTCRKHLLPILKRQNGRRQRPVTGRHIAAETGMPVRQKLIVSTVIIALLLAHAALFFGLKLTLLFALDFLADLTGQEVKDLTAVLGLRGMSYTDNDKDCDTHQCYPHGPPPRINMARV